MVDFNDLASKDVDSSTGLVFMHTYNKWHLIIKNKLKEYGITHPQFVVMTSIAYLMENKNEVSQVMIADVSGMDVMSISQILKLLEKKGIVSRKQHSLDTRAKSISLTEVGIKKLKETLPIVENVDRQFFSVLGNEEAKLINLLKKL